MRTRLKQAVLGTLVAASVAAPTLSAGAATWFSFEGSDYSRGESFSRLQVCDKESDSHGVHNDIYWWNGSYTGNFMRDGDGANNGCPITNWLQGSPFLFHRAVEEIPLSGDQFGAWANAG